MYIIWYIVLLHIGAYTLYIIPTKSNIEASEPAHFNLLQFPVSIV